MPFQITINPQKLRALQKKLEAIVLMPADKQTAQAAGNAAVREAKALIRGGTSPIRGHGKFPPYKNPARYPGNRKSSNVVNLFLSGQFLNAFKAKAVKRKKTWAFVIGFGGSSLARKKEDGHRHGAGGQPKRPIIPNPPAQQFHRRVVNAYLRVFQKRISRLIKR